jgi:hypothetical protein
MPLRSVGSVGGRGQTRLPRNSDEKHTQRKRKKSPNCYLGLKRLDGGLSQVRLRAGEGLHMGQQLRM